ncbi:hypothetical protein Dimus_009386 [Dionaea muscipula]
MFNMLGQESQQPISAWIVDELIEELKIYLLFFDRAGYGESDPYPKRSVKSEALDIQELAGCFAHGTYISCLWNLHGSLCWLELPEIYPAEAWCFASDTRTPLSHFDYLTALRRLPARDQWAFSVAHYAPWLFYWWMTQKWFPSISPLSGNLSIFSKQDREILVKLSQSPAVGQEKIRQQGVHESLHRDLLVGYGKWEFDPLDLENPFTQNEGSVHIWQGYEDRMIPFQLNRFISEKLHWIQYHEVPDGGHFIFYEQGICDSIIKALLLG